MNEQKPIWGQQRVDDERQVGAGECFLRVADKLVCMVLSRHHLPPFSGPCQSSALSAA